MQTWICGRCSTQLVGDAAGLCPSCGGDDVVPVASPRGQQLLAAMKPVQAAAAPARKTSAAAWFGLLVLLGGGGIYAAHYAGVFETLGSGVPAEFAEVAFLRNRGGDAGRHMWMAVVDANGKPTKGSGVLTVTVTMRGTELCKFDYAVNSSSFQRQTIGMGAFERKKTIWSTHLDPLCYTGTDTGERDGYLTFKPDGGTPFHGHWTFF